MTSGGLRAPPTYHRTADTTSSFDGNYATDRSCPAATSTHSPRHVDIILMSEINPETIDACAAGRARYTLVSGAGGTGCGRATNGAATNRHLLFEHTYAKGERRVRTDTLDNPRPVMLARRPATDLDVVPARTPHYPDRRP